MAIIVAGLLGNMRVFGQYVDSGAVDMSCDEECYCEGDSDDGTITVFDIPSSVERVRCTLYVLSSILSASHILLIPDSTKYCDFLFP